MKPIQYLNIALTAILVLAIAYNLLRGMRAEVDATAYDRMRRAERERDSVAHEAELWRVAAEALLRDADSVRSVLDSARAAMPPVSEVREANVKAMRYAALDRAVDTLNAE